MDFSKHQSLPGVPGGLESEVTALHRAAVAAADLVASRCGDLPPHRRQSARNLLAYLTLRSHDLASLQDRLDALGLASLRQAELQVLETLAAVVGHLQRLESAPAAGQVSQAPAALDLSGAALLEQNTDRLLGPRPEQRRARIMITLPDEAAGDRLLLQSLLEGGMDCARINCAYGDQAIWAAMRECLKEAEYASGLRCRVLMDLRGPKLRTGGMEQEQEVLRIRPVRAPDGRVIRPARIWLTPFSHSQAPGDAADACLVLDENWVRDLSVGDRIRLRDARGSKRNWRVTEHAPSGCWAESSRTTYVKNGTMLQRRSAMTGPTAVTTLASLPARDSVIEVRQGDVLVLSRGDEPGIPSIHGLAGELLRPGRIPLPIPAVFRDARIGEPISFDDNRIAGVIEQIDGEAMQVRIRHTRRPIERLASHKGINLPTTFLDLPALSDEDLEDLEFVAQHADIIGLSFTNTADDVRCMRDHLQKLGRQDVGVIFKIETRRGCANLPEILLEALKLPASGVMIARGDLAAECGFEHLSEVQEDILRMCAAAHMPVVWATGVLDGLAKRGHPARAEITDAAAAQRAECVLLGKGAYIQRAVHMLDDILAAGRTRQYKLQAQLHDLQGAPIPLDTVEARESRSGANVAAQEDDNPPRPAVLEKPA